MLFNCDLVFNILVLYEHILKAFEHSLSSFSNIVSKIVGHKEHKTSFLHFLCVSLPFYPQVRCFWLCYIKKKHFKHFAAASFITCWKKYIRHKKTSILHDALFMFLSLTTKLRKLIHLFLHWQINVSPIGTRSFQMRDFRVISRSVSKRGRWSK